MKARTLLISLALAVVAALALFDVGTAIRAARIEVSVERRPEDLAALNRRIAASARAAALRVAEAAKLAEKGAPAAAGTAAPAGDGAAASAINPLLLLARNPELRARYLDAYRGSQGRNWALFFNLHNLSPEAKEKLTDLLVQHEDDQMRLAQEAEDQGLNLDSRPLRKLSGQLNSANQGAIADLLGPADYAAYQQYSKDMGVAPAIVDFAGYASVTADPLTAAQGAQLTRVLSDASQKSPYGTSQYGTINSQQALAGAASVLDPNQLAALNAYLEKDQAGKRYRQLSAAK
ncbi:MAG TPA: hypothetical protein VHV47_00070 [Opitutaceae bacterium]|jgi:hypothetical protein|nr:hypothetical protein [Opitutaceae bacterium]